MARKTGIYRRRDSRFWWINVVLPSGRRVCLSTRTENRAEAETLLPRLKVDAFRESALGVKPRFTWQKAVIRYLPEPPRLVLGARAGVRAQWCAGSIVLL